MDWILGATPEVVFAFWLAVGVIILTLVMLLTILIMRWVVARRERRHARVAGHWRKALAQVPPVEGKTLPALPAGDLPGFLEAWNEAHEEASVEARPHMRRIAEQIGMRRHALAALGEGFHERATAIVGLGHLRDASTFDAVLPFMGDKSSIVSLCAARAISQIDRARAMSMFIPQILERDDWRQGSVARILKEVGNGLAAQELSSAVLRANQDMAPRMVRFLADVSPEHAAPVIRQILTSSVDDHLRSTCLQVMTDRNDIDLVRGLLNHPRWHVRMQAASALGRLGDASDRSRLVELLIDPQWWVRYRAAQALSSLPSVGHAEMRAIAQQQADPYARDIIDHVLAEEDMRVAA
jgi:hypothetical protein